MGIVPRGALFRVFVRPAFTGKNQQVMVFDAASSARTYPVLERVKLYDPYFERLRLRPSTPRDHACQSLARRVKRVGSPLTRQAYGQILPASAPGRSSDGRSFSPDFDRV